MTQDRRIVSRLETCLDCSFECNGKKYDAVILNISLKGAYLSSGFLPPPGSILRLAVKVPGAGRPVALEGQVNRSGHIVTDNGMKGRFGMRFPSPPLPLSGLIGKLVSQLK